jgi:glycerophosphoryl diester phosphodiesterase
MGRKLRTAAIAVAVLAAAVTLNNTSLFTAPPAGGPQLLAHRGLAQTFDSDGVTSDTCTAARIHSPVHRYLENTIASMAAAFAAGAAIVELDVHPTTDGQFAVFHDWTLDCRTDGHGVTREHSLADLKRLDVGYGYTADNGATYPFRGQGVGLMPSLDEVLTTFPERAFLIHVKSRDAGEGTLLAAKLGALPAAQRARLIVYGDTVPVAAVHERLPDLRTMGKRRLITCLLQYLGIGWSGYVPAACRNSMVLLPVNAAPWFWGWPNRFLARMAEVGTPVYVIGPYNGGDFSSGIDSADDLRRLPADYAGGIWTNRIDLIAPLTRQP